MSTLSAAKLSQEKFQGNSTLWVFELVKYSQNILNCFKPWEIGDINSSTLLGRRSSKFPFKKISNLTCYVHFYQMNEMIHDCASSVENKITNELKNYPLHDSLRDTKIEFSYCTHKSVL